MENSTGTPPQLQELHRRANVQLDPRKPLKMYIRSTELLYKQARIYFEEQNLEMAYTMFLKVSKRRQVLLIYLYPYIIGGPDQLLFLPLKSIARKDDDQMTQKFSFVDSATKGMIGADWRCTSCQNIRIIKMPSMLNKLPLSNE
ncbi:hypothetical protein HK104_008778 [Borealophlyctis nickersoniae]|nr:hypothetical protein HK104_008778 [Borealophlyctis nickersoniae]